MLKWKWLAMTLTVTGTAVLRVGCLMCTDSTTNTSTAIFQDQAQSHLFLAGLVPWAYLTCLFKQFECLGCTARDVEIQSKLSEWEFHWNTLLTTLQRRSAESIHWLASWFGRHRDRPGVYKFEVTTFTIKRILDFPYIRYPATGSRSWILLRLTLR